MTFSFSFQKSVRLFSHEKFMTNNFEAIDINILLQCRLFLLGIAIPLPWQNPILQKGRWKTSMSFNMNMCENSWIFWATSRNFPILYSYFFCFLPPETPQLSTRTQTPKPPKLPKFQRKPRKFHPSGKAKRLGAWQKEQILLGAL